MQLTSILWQNKHKRKVVLAVLTYNNKVLIVKRSKDETNHPGMWGFPGGGIDQEETSFEAIIRECEEEIGVTPIRIRFLTRDKRITWFVGMLPCDPVECVVLNWEHDDWALVDVGSMVGYDMIEGMEEIINVVLE